MIRNNIGSAAGALIPETSKGKKGKKRDSSAMDAQIAKAALNDFGVEYSKSSRATCVGCQNLIMKDDIRVKRTVHDTEVGAKFGGQALWHHLSCFASIRGDYSFYLGGENLPGFKSLSPEDKKTVKDQIK